MLRLSFLLIFSTVKLNLRNFFQTLDHFIDQVAFILTNMFRPFFHNKLDADQGGAEKHRSGLIPAYRQAG